MKMSLSKNKKRRILLMGLTGAVERPSAYFRFFANQSGFCVNVFTYGNRGGIPLLGRLLSLLHGAISVIHADVVVVLPMSQTKPIFMTLMRLARLFKKRIILDFYISVYESELQREAFLKESHLGQRMLAQERIAVHLSDIVIFLSQSEKVHYMKLLDLPASASQTAIVHLVTERKPQARLPFTKSVGNNRPLIVWWARLGNPIHGFEVIAETIKILLNSGFHGRFGIYGDGEDEYASARLKYPFLFEAESVDFRLDVNFSNGKLNRILENEADIALGAFGTSEKARTVILNKIVEASAYGIPSITCWSTGVSEIYVERSSILFSESTPQGLAQMIQKTTGSPEQIKVIGENARKTFQNHFSERAFEERLSLIFKD